MRTAINENRTVQLVMLGVLAVLGGLLFLKVTGSSGSQSSAAQTTSAGSPAASAGASGGAAAIAAPVGVSGSSSGSSVPQIPANLAPGPGVPKSLLASYRRGDAVALLAVRAGGIDDALVRASAKVLHRVPDLAVYATKAKHIARYAWLTQGVDLTELPALVILRPRKLSKGTPTATVTYGFVDGASVLQAARDALYRGPTHLAYHP